MQADSPRVDARAGRASYAQPMAFQPDDLLGEAALQAAVAALAERNQHHLADMSEREQADAVEIGRAHV